MCWPDCYTPPPTVITFDPVWDFIIDHYLIPGGRTFLFVADQVSQFFFYINDILVGQSPPNVTNWSYTPPTTPDPSPTPHIVRVVVQNQNGSTEHVRHWVTTSTPVTSKPVPYKVNPTTIELPPIPLNTTVPLNLTVSVDQCSTLTLKIDGEVYGTPHLVSTPNSAVVFTIGLDYLNNPANMKEDPSVVAIFAENSNGESEVQLIYYLTLIMPSPPVVTKRIPSSAEFEYPSRMNDNPPVCIVQVDQLAILTLKVDDVVVDIKEVTQVDTDITFEQGSNFISYMKSASHLGTHTLFIIAENCNGISNSVTWQWTLIPAIAQAAIEFEIDNALVPSSAIVGYEYESMMNSLPFHDNTGNFNSAGDYKFIIPSHGYLGTNHLTDKKGALGHYRDHLIGGENKFTIFSAYFDNPGPSGYSCDHLCNVWRRHHIELDISQQRFFAYTVLEDDSLLELGYSSNVSLSEILHIDFQAEFQYIYNADGTEPVLNVNPPLNQIQFKQVFIRNSLGQVLTKKPKECLKIRSVTFIGPSGVTLIKRDDAVEGEYWFNLGIVH